MLQRPNQRGLAVGLIVLASVLLPLVTLPTGSAAFAEDNNAPIIVFATPTNTFTDSQRLKTLNNVTLLAWDGNITSAFDNHIRVGYGDKVVPSTLVLSSKARLYFSTNGSLPVRNVVRSIELTDSTTPDPSPNLKEYRGALTAATNLTGGHTVRFMIEVYNAQGTAIFCDYGRDPATGNRWIKANACDATAPIGSGFVYKIDPSRPQLVVSSLRPPRDANIGAAGKVVVPSSTPLLGLRFNVTDSAFNTSSAFSAPLNVTSLNITATTTGTGATTLYLYDGTKAATSSANKFDITRTATTSTEQWFLGWNTSKPTVSWPTNRNITFTLALRDYAGNTVSTVAPVLFVDSVTPVVNNVVTDPSPKAQEEQGTQVVTVTGLGANGKVTVNVFEENMNRTAANTTAVKAEFFAKNTAGAFIFRTEVTTLPWKAQIGTNSSRNQYEGNVLLMPMSGTTAPKTAFFVKVNVTVLDAAGNVRNTVASNQFQGSQFQIKPGAPVITVTEPTSVGADNYVKTGPYSVQAVVVDTVSPGVSDASVKLRITNETGSFISVTGWTVIDSNTFEKVMTKGVGSNYSADIPDAVDATEITYLVKAADTIGNLNTTEEFGLIVDKTAPLLNESGPEEWRSLAPHAFLFTGLDTGVGVNVSSAKFHWRPEGGSYTTVNMTANAAETLFNVTISPTVDHEDVIEYYAELADLLGTATTNGTSAAPLSYTIDLNPPTVTFDAPLPTSPTSTGLVSLYALASDDLSGVEDVIFEGRYKQTVGGTLSDWILLKTGNETDNAIVDMCLGGGITYEFRLRATDQAGNIGEATDEITVEVTGDGCQQTVAVAVTQPVLIVDADRGAAVEPIEWVASTSGPFTPANLIRVKIEFSPHSNPNTPDEERIWVLVADNVLNTGAYAWTVDAPSCTACKIRVTGILPDGTMGNGTTTFEIINGALTTDFDGNGIFDDCELVFFGSLGQDPEGDPDGDGLDTAFECGLGTNPSPMDLVGCEAGVRPEYSCGFDTDRDGYSDGVEVRVGRNPLDANDAPDDIDLRYEQWEWYYLIVPAVFLAVSAVFLLGIARRW